MPGEIESQRRQERRAQGIEMPDGVYRELEALAQQYQVPFTI